jgi:hypothetical protein
VTELKRYIVAITLFFPNPFTGVREQPSHGEPFFCFRYHGEKLQPFGQPKRPRGTGLGLISTIYDEPLPQDQGELLLRRQPPTSMKFRTEAFVRSSSCALNSLSEPE